MKALIIFLSVVLISTNSFSQKEYKVLMDDMSVNFYEVCESAEDYFTTHNKEEKGSGWN